MKGPGLRRHQDGGRNGTVCELSVATELDSHYRNPSIANNIQISPSSKDMAKVVIGYSPLTLAEKEELPGGGSSGYQWDYLTSRHWRTLYLTGRLDGYGELTLMGYTSTTSGGMDKWVSMFHICDEGLAPGEKSNFSGAVKLDNYILYSEADSSANVDSNNDLLAVRKPGAVQLIVEDDALRNAKVDLTRAHTVNAADNGTSFEGRERMDLYHILLVQKDATLAGLEGVVTLVRTVPEPGTAVLGLLGVGGLLLRRRKT